MIDNAVWAKELKEKKRRRSGEMNNKYKPVYDTSHETEKYKMDPSKLW